MKISNDQIRASYNIAKRVHDGKLEKETGAKELHAQHGMNLGSARDYINNFNYLMRGSVFHRTMNVFATDHYLASIKNDFGLESLDQAIQAVQKHIDYYEGIRPSKLHALREVLNRYLPLLEKRINLAEHEEAFYRSVQKSFEESTDARKKRLKAAVTLPRRVTTTSIIFVRNPDVVAEVLHRANGTCERCKKPAPFFRIKDQSPYLEVHHTIQLANGGEDTTSNAVALCPNCHRELHFGVNIARL